MVTGIFDAAIGNGTWRRFRAGLSISTHGRGRSANFSTRRQSGIIFQFDSHKILHLQLRLFAQRLAFGQSVVALFRLVNGLRASRRTARARSANTRSNFILVNTREPHPDRSTRRLLALGFALLVIPFLPASNLFFRVGFVVVERNLYLPSIGFCLVLSVAATHVYRCATWKRTTKACVYALLALYAAQAFARAAAWRTETSLFESGLRVCPRNAKVHYNVGKLLSESGRDNDLSVAHYREAVRLHPGYDQAWNNLGNLLKDSGDVVEAEACLHRALAANAEFAAAWMNLGIVKAALGKTDEAENCYRTAIKHRRKYPDAFYNLGNLYIELKRVDEAATAFRNATRLKATHVNAWLNLALLHENGGRLVEAESVLEEARRHLPDHVGFASNLANVLAKQGRFDESEPYYKMAISADPKSASLHGNLAVMYHRAGKLRGAEREYALSLDLDPSNELMKDNLRKLVNQRAKENN